MKFILTLAGVILALSLNAQTAIDGIWKLKPGVSTTAVIADIEKELDKKVIEISGTDKFFIKKETDLTYEGQKRKKIIIKLINANTLPDKKEYGYSYINHSPVDPKHEVYYISGLAPAGIDLPELYLFFSNGVLAKIQCKNTKPIEDALKAKYGDPQTEVIADTIHCIYKLTGRETKEVDNTINYIWANGKVKAVNMVRKYHDSNCKEQYTGGFSIVDTELFALYDLDEFQADAELRDRIKSNNKAGLKDKLNDF